MDSVITQRAQASIAHDVRVVGNISAVPTILEVVAQTTGMRFAAIARVTESSWIACAVLDRIDFGLLPGGELEIEHTICNEIRRNHQPVLFDHASADPVFSSHPVPKMYGFESYVSIPIFRRDGSFFGTLCALDPEPAKLDKPNVLKTLSLFAQLIAAQLDIEERLERSDSALLISRQNARLRDQFIAVLGHDLRNPLQMISLGAEVLEDEPLAANAQRTLKHIRASCERMGELIHNILDFARGKLGGGIPVSLARDADLAEELSRVVDEVQATHPDRVIQSDFSIGRSVTCDHHRIAQLLANLLTNAVHHGVADQPVAVSIRCDDEFFELAVSNAGPPIPEKMIPRLFQPFSRTASDSTRPGLGLGLYIAAEVAKAHRGTLEVSSSDESGTCFVFRMPVESIAKSGEPQTAGC